MKFVYLFMIGTLPMSPLCAQVVQLDTADSRGLFPLMQSFKKKAEAAGAQFPKTYGIAGSMYYQTQRMDINKITFGNLVLEEDNGVINFGQSNIKNTVVSSQFRADLWVLPFVNLYGMIGRVNTFNDIDLSINLSPPSGSPSVGDINLLQTQQIANINGTVVGAGTVIAGGYGKIFVNVNITWAQTWLNELNSTQKSFVAFPMAGVSTNFANLFMGGIYQNTGSVNKGSFTGQSGQVINYSLEYSARRWNYAFGFNKSIGNWSMVVIQGVGARTNGVVEVGYRFGK